MRYRNERLGPISMTAKGTHAKFLGRAKSKENLRWKEGSSHSSQLNLKMLNLQKALFCSVLCRLGREATLKDLWAVNLKYIGNKLLTLFSRYLGWKIHVVDKCDQ